MAMACAAFCIPTSIMIVLLSPVLSPKRKHSPAAAAVAQSRRTVVASPRLWKLSTIVPRCWMKKTAARKSRAGKARRERTLSVLMAHSFFQCLSPMPRRIGRSIVTMFCINRLRTGRWIPAAAPVCAVTACIISGMVNSVTMLLTAVRETESATSPFASLEKTLLELPPGQQAMSTSPMLIIGLRLSNDAMPQAMSGNIIICPARPAMKALNLFSTRRKSLPSSVSPRSNISNVRMGSTIRILFMSTYTLNTTSLPKGIRARPAILKWRVPNGMPMMVMQRRTPKKMCIRQAQSPPKISQRMFSGMLMQPMELSDFLMVEPKGQRQYSPSLKVCNATGIPIMVMAIARLPVK